MVCPLIKSLHISPPIYSSVILATTGPNYSLLNTILLWILDWKLLFIYEDHCSTTSALNPALRLRLQDVVRVNALQLCSTQASDVSCVSINSPFQLDVTGIVFNWASLYLFDPWQYNGKDQKFQAAVFQWLYSSKQVLPPSSVDCRRVVEWFDLINRLGTAVALIFHYLN